MIDCNNCSQFGVWSRFDEQFSRKLPSAKACSDQVQFEQAQHY